MTEDYPSSTSQAGGLGPMPGENQIRTESVPAPADVENAFKLWLVSIGLGVLGIIASLLFADRDSLRQDVQNANPNFDAGQLDTAVTVGLVGGAVVAAIIIGLELFFVFKMRAGRNWSRIVLTVLGVLGVLSGLYGLIGGVSIGAVVNIISIIVVIAAIVFMFKPAASAYFSRPKY